MIKKINKKFPGAFILLNNKNESSYYKVFSIFKNIITLEESVKIDMISYSIDFELAICNSLEKIFPNIKHYGCYFHYCYNIGKNIKNKITSKLKKYKINKESLIFESIIKFKNEILMLPFEFNKNKDSIQNIFNNYKHPIFNNFKTYFNNQWKSFFDKDILNYKYAIKEQHSNSFIENYNKRIKMILCKYIIFKFQYS